MLQPLLSNMPTGSSFKVRATDHYLGHAKLGSSFIRTERVFALALLALLRAIGLRFARTSNLRLPGETISFRTFKMTLAVSSCRLTRCSSASAGSSLCAAEHAQNVRSNTSVRPFVGTHGGILFAFLLLGVMSLSMSHIRAQRDRHLQQFWRRAWRCRWVGRRCDRS